MCHIASEKTFFLLSDHARFPEGVKVEFSVYICCLGRSLGPGQYFLLLIEDMSKDVSEIYYQKILPEKQFHIPLC